MRRFMQNLAEISARISPLGFAGYKAWAILIFERFWRHFTPLFLVGLTFFATLWLNIFLYLPHILHVLLLAVFAGAFAVSLWCLFRLRLPDWAAIRQRLEHDNALLYGQLGLDEQTLVDNSSNQAKALWSEHKRRMELHKPLKSHAPRPNIAAYDPLGLRFIIYLAWGVAFSFQLGSNGGQFRDAFYFGQATPNLKPRIDAWINPPAYTNRPPVYLLSNYNGDSQNNADSQNANQPLELNVPEKSQLTVQINDYGRGRTRLLCQSSGEKLHLSPKRGETHSVYHLNLSHSALCHLQGAGFDKQWLIHIEDDKKPDITWVKPPERALNGLLKLDYVLSDDYNVHKAWAEIEPIEEQGDTSSPTPYFASLAPQKQDQNKKQMRDETAREQADRKSLSQNYLVPPPKIDLQLPKMQLDKQTGLRGGQAHSQADLSHNPWAGLGVNIRLVVEDGAGQQVRSTPMRLVLPQKNFVNPLARALIEQRQILTQNIHAVPRVLDMIEALVLWPEKTLDLSTSVPLYSLRSRLRAVPPTDIVEQLQQQHIALTKGQMRQIRALELKMRREKLTDISSYMWEIANGIDGGALAAAERDLKQAAQALRDALRNGASDEEIGQLIQNLRQAMQKYLAERAEHNKQTDNKDSHNSQILGDSDLEKKLKALEEAAKKGNRGQGEELLSEFEDLMKNLQVTPGGKGQGSGSSSKQQKMQQQMDSLSDIMRQQQQLMDDTHQLDEQNLRGDNSESQAEEKRKSLQDRQEKLQKQLEETEQNLKEQGVAPENSFDNAKRQMQNAQKALQNDDNQGALDKQTKALEALRDDAQAVIENMRKALQKANKDKSGEEGNENSKGQNTDPLGRPQGSAEGQQDNGFSNETATQRARRIMDAIRKRLGNLTPQQEKEYLERLLEEE